jgi:hypothetical protein
MSKDWKEIFNLVLLVIAIIITAFLVEDMLADNRYENSREEVVLYLITQQEHPLDGTLIELYPPQLICNNYHIRSHNYEQWDYCVEALERREVFYTN